MNLLQDQIIVTHLILFAFFGLAWCATSSVYSRTLMAENVKYFTFRICWTILSSFTLYTLALLWEVV